MSMSNLARIAKVVALLLFLMPWITISCSPQAMGPMSGTPSGMSNTGDMTIATATGAQLAMGSVRTTNPNPTAAGPPNPFTSPSLPILGGGILILLALGVSFVMKGSQGALIAAGACAAAAAALCYAVMVQIPAAVRASFATPGPGGEAPPINPAELAQMIQIKVEIGFWLTIAAIAAAVVLNVLGMRGAAAAPAVAAAPPETPPAD